MKSHAKQGLPPPYPTSIQLCQCWGILGVPGSIPGLWPPSRCSQAPAEPAAGLAAVAKPFLFRLHACSCLLRGFAAAVPAPNRPRRRFPSIPTAVPRDPAGIRSLELDPPVPGKQQGWQSSRDFVLWSRGSGWFAPIQGSLWAHLGVLPPAPCTSVLPLHGDSKPWRTSIHSHYSFPTHWV